MLKRYKNAFFEMIQAAGLNVGDFVAEESWTAPGPSFVVTYKPAGLSFTATNDLHDADGFLWSYTKYTPGFPQPVHPESYPKRILSFADVQEAFQNWLSSEVRLSIDEELLPDLWATAAEQLSDTTATTQLYRNFKPPFFLARAIAPDRRVVNFFSV